MNLKIIKTITSLRGVWETFEQYKQRAVLLIVMIVITSFLEAFSIGMLLPVMEMIVQDKAESTFGRIVIYFFQGYPPDQILSFILIIFFLIVLLKNILIYLKNRIQLNLTFGMRSYWMQKLMRKYLRANYDFIVNSKQGTLINNVLVETEKAQFCLKFFIQFLSSGVLSLFMLGVLFIMSWEVTGAMLVVVSLLTFISNNTVGLYSRRVGAEKLKYAKSVSNSVSESITAIKQVKTLGMEGRVLDGVSKTVEKYTKTMADFFVYARLPQSIGEVVVVFMLLITVFYILFFKEVTIKSIAPMVTVFVVIGNRVSVQAALLVNSSMQILSNIVSLRRIYDLVKDDGGLEELDEGQAFEGLAGDIVCQDLSFSYVEGNPVLDQLNFVIPKEKFVFIIGSSGSGKSTLVDLLVRLRKPQGGAILVNGRDLSEINMRSWRESVGYVSQDIILFNKSVKENVRDGRPQSTDEEILSICKKVNAHEFVQKLPEQYNSNVGDRGVKLSGGEQQRLVLARSMIRDPEFLIFDEATSALDQQTEEQIIQEIKAESVGKTVLFITHRLSTTVHADLVYELSGGKITRVS
jgi:ABC-type multidrug transport system fused ATPase/permease subunit